MQRPRLELGVGLLLSRSPSLYPSLSPSSEIFHSSLPFSLCPAGTIGFIRIAATPSPPKVAPPAKNAKARLNPEKRIPLVSSSLAAPRACPPARSLARSSARLRSVARPERSAGERPLTGTGRCIGIAYAMHSSRTVAVCRWTRSARLIFTYPHHFVPFVVFRSWKDAEGWSRVFVKRTINPLDD